MDYENDGVNVDLAQPQGIESVETGVSEAEDFNSQAAFEEPAEPQSAQVNAQFADARRKRELEEYKGKFSAANEENTRIKAELEQIKAQTQVALSPYFNSGDLDTMLLEAEAQAKGMTVSRLQQQKAGLQALAQQQAQINSQLEYYREREMEYQEKEADRLISEDLKAVQALDGNIKSLDELGEEFVRLRFTKNPLTGEQFSVNEIYNHLKSKIKPVPPTSGALQAKAEGKRETDYTNMSDAEFEKQYNKIVYGG